MRVKHAGLCITPEIVGAKSRYRLPAGAPIGELANMAADRVRPLMRDLIDGHPLTNVLVKAYLQGFIDYHQAVETPNE